MPKTILLERIKIALAFGCLALWVMLLNPFAARGQQGEKQSPAMLVSEQPRDYSRFIHQTHQGLVKVPNTNFARDLQCDSCHERPGAREISNGIVATTDRNKLLSLKFPGHKACVECHIVQFTSRPQQTCTICHSAQQGQAEGLPARPPQREFPRRYDFNAFFDARQHELHVTYALPNNGQKLDCNFCHQQTAKPSFLTIASHPECYACHSPRSGDPKASQKSGCVVCHTEPSANVQPFSAKYASRAYGARFTHKSHVAYLNNNCSACHTISGGYNQPLPTSIRIKQHLSPNERSGRGCFSCHDGGVHFGRKVFSGETGGEGGSSCDKCHTRDDFKVIPTSG
ncbi:MAG: cytochrome c3 family protein [Blastocatellales bacterium]